VDDLFWGHTWEDRLARKRGKGWNEWVQTLVQEFEMLEQVPQSVEVFEMLVQVHALALNWGAF
jgi:hypothetical protein